MMHFQPEQSNGTFIPPGRSPQSDESTAVNQVVARLLSSPETPGSNGHPHDPELVRATFPKAANISSWSILQRIVSDLRGVGVSIGNLAKEAVRGGIAEATRWGAEFSIVCLALNAAAERSPMALGYMVAGMALYSVSTWGDRIWRTRVDEFDRAYAVSLYDRLLRTLGRSSIKELDSPNRSALLELHHGRVDDISNLVESSVSLPCYMIKMGLSVAALAYADWRIPLVAGIAIIPGLLVKRRHMKEDLNLEESQSRKTKLLDTISDQAYSANGSVRMILGRMVGVQKSLERIQLALNKEKNAHERRQAGQEVLADTAFYGVLFAGMYMLYSQYITGGLSIGALGFLWLQLFDLGSDLEDQGDKVRSYYDTINKAGRFYGFTEMRTDLATLDFPSDHTLSFQDVKFVRGGDEEESSSFEVRLPNFELRPGDFLVIHGASGAGKTTIQKHLAFGAKPESGDYRVGGVPADQIDFKQWTDAIAHCGATPALLDGHTIHEALTLDPEGEKYLEARIEHPLIKELIEDLRTKHGLETRIGAGLERGREFSTGELLRLTLVPALIPERKLLFLDEVTSNQSDSFVTMVGQAIAEQREHGTIVIFVTHSKRFDGEASHIMNVSKGSAELEAVPTTSKAKAEKATDPVVV